MASSHVVAGISGVLLLATLLTSSVLSTDAQGSTINNANNNGIKDPPACPVQGDNYCVCQDGSCGSCAECAGCNDKQCIGPPQRWTGPRPKLSRAATGETNSTA
jgi:hypothetical protein